MFWFDKHSLAQTPAFLTKTKHTVMVVFHRYQVNDGDFNYCNIIETPTFSSKTEHCAMVGFYLITQSTLQKIVT